MATFPLRSPLPLILLAFVSPAAAQIGTNFCAAEPNSTGLPSSMGATGSTNVHLNHLTLDCQQLPAGSFGYFLASMSGGFVANPAGSAGNLCLSQPIGRYINSVQTAGSSGIVSLPIDLGAIPDPLGPYALAPGDSVSFQYWHRDTSPQGPTSNFSDGLEMVTSGRCELGSGFFPAAVFRACCSADLIEAADFNGDGLMDVVRNSDSSNLLSVLLGTGDGRFLDANVIDLGSVSTGLAVGDMDGDGDVDVVTSNYTSGTVSVVLNSGGGVFVPQVPTQVGAELAGLDLSDIDGDGDLDVVVADAAWTVNTVSILRNSGGGALSLWTTLASANTPRAVKLVDLDADGSEDLVVGNDNGTLRIWMNSGAGFSGAGQLTSGSNRPSQLDAGDFDGDGHVDLAVANPNGFEFQIKFGAGDGTFSSTSEIAAGTGIGHLEAADLDGDGNLDLVASRPNLPVGLSLFMGLGDGTFMAPTTSPLGTTARSVVAVDLDGKPELELVAATTTSGGLIVLTNEGDDGYHTFDTIEVARGLRGLTHGDVNGDGIDDFVVASSFDDTISIGSGMPDGSFQVGAAIPTGDGPLSVALGDLDGNGHVDVATTNFSGASFTLLLNQGGGLMVTGDDIPTGNNPGEIAVGDLDQDGDLDLAVTNGWIAPQEGLSIFLNDGLGSFQQSGPIYNQPATSGGLELADLDQDGDLDAVFAIDEASSQGVLSGFTIMVNNGQGVFGAPMQITTEQRVQDLVLADLDADGDLDVVALAGFLFEVFENLGGLSFGPSRTVQSPEFSLNVVQVGDINLDGHLDVVTFGGVASVYLGRGDLTFDEWTQYGLGTNSREGVLVDTDGDGRLDLVATQSLNLVGAITVHRGVCR